MTRGYFGIGICDVKKEINIGSLFRSAHNFGAAFVFSIGDRYKSQKSDTTKAFRHIPFFEYKNIQDFIEHRPKDCQLVGLEYPEPSAKLLNDYIHPERAIYLLGAEDHGLSPEILSLCDCKLYIPTKWSINVAVTGSIVMYDRQLKLSKMGV
jgi:tRNA G18 (ribose-2'-O)-methylase SpoU